MLSDLRPAMIVLPFLHTVQAVDLENDRNYKAAEERFLAFRSQLAEVRRMPMRFKQRSVLQPMVH